MRKFKEISYIREPITANSIENAGKINELINRVELQGEILLEILERHPNVKMQLPPRLFDKFWDSTEEPETQ
jgi:hypothetical protein